MTSRRLFATAAVLVALLGALAGWQTTPPPTPTLRPVRPHKEAA